MSRRARPLRRGPRRLGGAAAALLLLLLGACSGGELIARGGAGDGIGGTGISADDGIGGTGISGGDGIGGTGALAGADGIGGTGIVGTITGFGSIFVNGLEIAYDAATPVDMDGEAVAPDALAVGQVVEVLAAGEGDRVTARSISVRHALVGPVEEVDATAGSLRVLGQTVRLAADAPAGDVDLAALRAGDTIAVSGLRDGDGAVLASRLDRRARGTEVLVSGPVQEVAPGRIVVAGTPVALPPGAVKAGIAPGDVVRLRGRWTGREVAARALRREPAVPFGGRVRRLVVEGIVAGPVRGDRLRLGRLVVEAGPGTAFRGPDGGALTAGRRTWVDMQVGPDRRLVATRITLERDFRRFARPPAGGKRKMLPPERKKRRLDRGRDRPKDFLKRHKKRRLLRDRRTWRGGHRIGRPGRR